MRSLKGWVVYVTLVTLLMLAFNAEPGGEKMRTAVLIQGAIILTAGALISFCLSQASRLADWRNIVAILSGFLVIWGAIVLTGEGFVYFLLFPISSVMILLRMRSPTSRKSRGTGGTDTS